MQVQTSVSASKPGPTAPVTPCEEKLGFARGFLPRFLRVLEAEVPEAERRAILQARGRSCARRGPVRAAREAGGDIDALVATLAGWLGKENARRDGSVVQIRYERCLCPALSGVTEPLSPSFCHCSEGWLHEMFETVVGREVEVLAQETIRRGGTACRFLIRTEARP